MHRSLFFLTLSFLCTVAWGQFFNFGNFFGQQQQEPQHRAGASHWQAQAEALRCAEYLCPATLDCVPRPVDCPCPYVQDVKCIIPDAAGEHQATVVCARGTFACQEVERLMKRKF
ncbi:hypothetical protein BDN72DRAFT_408573 [Pluteus cervinus]|uniref:Uncharacterized protein n=1 Tax=Pluteus cervinus TaxID=181527 RepID=A0ACD3B1C9_9AGAR|nr:hypothetical protein BDN72DRAFT_408573 [Pluteus cervinus]